MPAEDTIVAPATPAGESAIAVVRVGGPLCDSLVGDIFGSTVLNPRFACLGKYRNRRHIVLDQVVYTYFEGKASYTGEPVLEISCHGSPFVTQKIVEDLLARGCRMAEPGEFSRRAFLNGKMDLSQAEAVVDLIRARSDNALEIANRQLDGSVRNGINQLMDKLLGVVSHLEAQIDFPEEDLPEEDVEGLACNLRELSGALHTLISNSRYNELAREGIRAAIVGPPNAGKSSLLNALVGEERVLVSEEPGTTRDFVERGIVLGSHLVILVDTAGLREGGEAVEIMGMTKTMEQIESSEIVFYVLDSTLTCPASRVLVEQLLEVCKSRILVVENKMDHVDSQSHSDFMPESQHLRVSALTGEGIEEFKDRLMDILDSDLSSLTEDSILVRARHAAGLSTAAASIATALEKLEASESPELTASDLRAGLDSLGVITGKFDNERMLDKLFENFCIGK